MITTLTDYQELLTDIVRFTNGMCFLCDHKFTGLKDVMKREAVLIQKAKSLKVACKDCTYRYS